MLPALIFFIILLILLIIFGAVLVLGIASLIINGILLYLVILALFRDFKKKAKQGAYMVSAVLSLIIVFFAGRLVPFLWKITTFFVLVYVLRNTMYFWHNKI